MDFPVSASHRDLRTGTKRKFNMTTMRAKLKVTSVTKGPASYVTEERLTFAAVYKDGAYPADGSDEDNTFSKFTPQAELSMVLQNPALLGKFEVGQKFYVDFTPAPA